MLGAGCWALANELAVPYPGRWPSAAPSWPSLQMHAGYDTSPRDLKDNWLPVTCLVLVAVGLTTGAVALVAHGLSAMPWARAIALGAILAPPDAAAVAWAFAPPGR